ncbi:MAG: YfhO family protein [Syntrophaceae bacterium]|nr:YfhO family protein [Syntrophaceae bacterium]
MTDREDAKRRWVRSTGFLAGLTLFISLIIFFHGLLPGRYIFFERDLGPYFIPPRFFWVESIKSGHFPLWNPYQFTGHPFFANPQYGVLYPLNSLFFLLPFDIAFNAIIVLHFLLGGLFTYFLLRELKTDVTGSLISGLIFMLSGYLLSVHSLLTILLSVIWTPLIMIFFRRAIANPGFKNEVLTAILVTFSFLGGGIEIVYGNFFVLLIMLISFPSSHSSPLHGVIPGEAGTQTTFLRRQETIAQESGFPRNKYGAGLVLPGMTKYIRLVSPYIKGMRSLIVVSILFLFLSAIQLLPFLELFHHSIRGKGVSYQEATIWSFAPKDVLLFFLPDAYGYWLDMKKYWVNQCWFKTLYTGGLPFILSLIFFLTPHPRPLPQCGEGNKNNFPFSPVGESEAEGRGKKFFLFLMLFSLFLSFGKYNPLYPYLFKYLPFLNGIRYPVKFLSIFIIVLSITAGLGFQRLTEFSKEAEKKRFKNLLIIFSLVFGLFLLFLVVNHKGVEEFLKLRGIDLPDFNRLSVNLHHAKRFLFYLTLFFLLLRVGHEVKWKWWTKVLLVFFLTADLFGNMGFYGKVKTQDYFKKTETVEIISSDKDRFRIFSTPKTISFDIPILIANASSLNIFKEKHFPAPNLLYRLYDIWGVDVVRLKRVDDLYIAFVNSPSISATNLVDLYGIKYVISVTLLEKEPRFELIYSRLEGLEGKKEDLLKENTVKLYRVRYPFPRAWLVKNFKVMDDDAVLSRMISKEFHPGDEVLLEEEPIQFRNAKLGVENPKSETRNPKPSKRLVGKVEFTSETNNELCLRVEAKEDAILVLSDTYYTGWKVFVSGAREKIYRANYNFRAVPLKAGEREVRFVYDPLSFKIGELVSIFTLVGIGVYFAKRKRHVT